MLNQVCSHNFISNFLFKSLFLDAENFTKALNTHHNFSENDKAELLKKINSFVEIENKIMDMHFELHKEFYTANNIQDIKEKNIALENLRKHREKDHENFSQEVFNLQLKREELLAELHSKLGKVELR